MGQAFAVPMVSCLIYEVPEETGVNTGDWSSKLDLILPCDAMLCADPLLHPAESRSRKPVWQQAGAVMVQMAAERGQWIPQGPSIIFLNFCLSGRLCSWLGFSLLRQFAFKAT